MAGGEPGARSDGRARDGRAGASPRRGGPYVISTHPHLFTKLTPPHAWLYEPPFQYPGQWHTWECTKLVAHHSIVLLAGGSRVHLRGIYLCFGSGAYAVSPDPSLNVLVRIRRLQLYVSLFDTCRCWLIPGYSHPLYIPCTAIPSTSHTCIRAVSRPFAFCGQYMQWEEGKMWERHYFFGPH